MRASKDRATAALKRAYCLATGVNLRTAQRHARSNHPDWQKFLGTQAISAIKMREGERRSVEQVAALTVMSPTTPRDELAPPARPAADDDDDLEAGLSEAQRMERRHWDLWKESSDGWRVAVRENDPNMSMAYAAITLKAREAYVKASDAREAWEISQRRVVSINEWNAVHQNFIVPLANILDNIAAELAALTNPDDPDFARAKLQQWKQERLQPRIDSLLAELEMA